MRTRHLWVALICLMICAVAVLADTLKLRDGTVLEGKVIPQGDGYWIKLQDGSSRVVKKIDVVSYTPGDSKATPATPSAPAAKPAPAAPKPATPAPGVTSTSASFAAVKAKAERVDAPIQAVQLWEKFIESKPNVGDLEAAKAELEKWNKLQKDGAERIKGQWVGGVERKRIVKQAKAMVSDGVKQMEEGQTTAALKKFEDAVNLYPQSFEGNFWLGLYYLKKSTISERARYNVEYMDKAIRTLETAARIAPKSSSVWSNLAIGYAFKDKHQEAVKAAYKAATMHESEGTVQNLISCISNAPRGLREQAWAKHIVEDAVLMAERHHVKGGGWYYVPPAETDEIPGLDNPAGTVWSGSGFFVTTDGYIVTNHHVATGESKSPIKPEIAFRIRLDDGTEKTAQLIAVDDAADIALMKITPDKPVIPLQLAAELPPQGADVLVLGYPATGESEHTLEIGPGTVKSVHEGDEFEVWFDMNTTHGNSGGPIVDASNRVISIVTAYRQSFNMSIFLGVSTHQIKAFFEKIADKAPKVEYVAAPKEMPSFSSENLTKSARASTVLVLAIRSAEGGSSSSSSGD